MRGGSDEVRLWISRPTGGYPTIELSVLDPLYTNPRLHLPLGMVGSRLMGVVVACSAVNPAVPQIARFPLSLFTAQNGASGIWAGHKKGSASDGFLLFSLLCEAEAFAVNLSLLYLIIPALTMRSWGGFGYSRWEFCLRGVV